MADDLKAGLAILDKLRHRAFHFEEISGPAPGDTRPNYDQTVIDQDLADAYNWIEGRLFGRKPQPEPPKRIIESPTLGSWSHIKGICSSYTHQAPVMDGKYVAAIVQRVQLDAGFHYLTLCKGEELYYGSSIDDAVNVMKGKTRP